MVTTVFSAPMGGHSLYPNGTSHSRIFGPPSVILHARPAPGAYDYVVVLSEEAQADLAAGISCAYTPGRTCQAYETERGAELRLGPLCGLRRVFPDLRPPRVETELWLDLSTLEARYRDCRAKLAPREFLVLAVVANARGDFVSVDSIGDLLWSSASRPAARSRTLDALASLRAKCAEQDFPPHLVEMQKQLRVRIA